MTNKKLLVGTLAYGAMVHVDYMLTLFSLQTLIPLDLFLIWNESIFGRGVDKIFTYFINHLEKYSHLLFLDSDIGITPESILKLMKANKNVIGAAVRLKKEDEILLNIGNVIKKDRKLWQVERLGSAVMLIKDVVGKKVLKYKDKFEQYEKDGEMIYNIFKTKIENGRYISWDYNFCDILRELGEEIWVDMSIPTAHIGNRSLVFRGIKQ